MDSSNEHRGADLAHPEFWAISPVIGDLGGKGCSGEVGFGWGPARFTGPET